MRSSVRSDEVTMTSSMTRRDFIRGAAAALGAAAVFGQDAAAPAKKTRVVLIRHPEALDVDSAFNEPVIQGMLDEAGLEAPGRWATRSKPSSGSSSPKTSSASRPTSGRSCRHPPRWRRPSSAGSWTPASRRRISASTTTPCGRTPFS
ncbi:MAG: twin-arginine translocation signal domain-containing protein [Desulfosudis oleivorans]|nr:twin-arginine translocation signal domain-containing protein [Desulfosudis oleivorans]